MNKMKTKWVAQSFLLYAPFLIEFAAFPLFMMIKPEWLGGLLFWVFYTYLFYGLSIFIHAKWRKSIKNPIEWNMDMPKVFISIIIGVAFRRLLAFSVNSSQVPMIIRDFSFALQTKPLFMGVGRFILQIIYYMFEFTLVALIIDCAQKASECMKANQNIPWGGIFLGLTWGLGHAITKGSISSGLGSMCLSLIAGFLYVKLGNKPSVAWLVIASAYLI